MTECINFEEFRLELNRSYCLVKKRGANNK